MCTKLFADFGSDVLKIEPPGGCRLRYVSPDGDRERSPHFLYLNTNKRSLTLDLSVSPARRRLRQLGREADVIVEDFAPSSRSRTGLQPCTTLHLSPSAVHVSITPFGRTGPYRHYRGNEFTSLAAGGLMYITGDPKREPLATGGLQAEYMAGLNAFVAALAALHARLVSGLGARIDISMVDCVAANLEYTVTMYTYMGAIRRRWFGRHHFSFPQGELYPCRDGHAVLCLSREGGLPMLALLIGRPELAEHPLFGAMVNRLNDEAAFHALVEPWFREHDKREACDLGQELRMPMNPVLDVAELLADEHLQARRFFVAVDHPQTGPLSYPGAPFRMSRTPWRAGRAPLLGEHDQAPWGTHLSPRQPERGNSSTRRDARLPLAGVRVLDLTVVYAGPTCTRLLADMGAEVIKIEAVQRPEGIRRCIYAENDPGENWWDRSGYFVKRNLGKRGVTLDLTRAEGVQLLKRLAATSDVVAENFSPRVMRNFGLDYDSLCRISPDIIMISLSGFGQHGPRANWVAYGMGLEAAAGLTALTGYHDGAPMRTGMSWTDPLTGIAGAAAVLIALRHKHHTGKGQYIDLSEQECGLTFIGEVFLEHALSGAVPPRRGNRHPRRAPQGVYPCLGDDAWVAISVENDADWHALCRALERGDWATGDGLAHVTGRLRRQDEIDSVIAGWTRRRTNYQVMHLLQEAGVPAAAVLDAKELLLDPHLRARRLFEWMDHQVIGLRPYPRAFPVLFDGSPFGGRGPAPLLGEHTRRVLRETLGLAEKELDRLEEQQIIGGRPVVQPSPGCTAPGAGRFFLEARTLPGYSQRNAG